MSDNSSINFPKLSTNNYNTWVGNMRAALQKKGAWKLVKGVWTCPADCNESVYILSVNSGK
jgi:hypothetical protein